MTSPINQPILNTSSYESDAVNINWDALSVDELIDILDRIGTGFSGTLKIIMSKLKIGEKSTLMKLVYKLGIGKASQRRKTLRALRKVLMDNLVSSIIKNLLILLTWRADKKFGITDDFSALPPMNFQPSF
jgi:hypothetical protein